jgi:hypothetical protein
MMMVVVMVVTRRLPVDHGPLQTHAVRSEINSFQARHLLLGQKFKTV